MILIFQEKSIIFPPSRWPRRIFFEKCFDFLELSVTKLVRSFPKLNTLVVNEVFERYLGIIPRRITVKIEDKDWPVLPDQ